MTKEEAIALANTGWWKNQPPEAIVSFQLFEERLCMDWADFQEAVSKCLHRPVWTHEFARGNADALQREFLNEKAAPTFEEICALIPEVKRIVIIQP